MVTRHLLDGAELTAEEGHGGAVTLIQPFGSAANLNIHLHCLVPKSQAFKLASSAKPLLPSL